MLEKIETALTYYYDKTERLLAELEEAQAIIEMYNEVKKELKKRNGRL